MVGSAVSLALRGKSRAEDRGDILEQWSDEARRIPGWVQKPLACDFIAYAYAPTPAQLRRQPELPPMPITGGKKARDQVSLPLDEPLLVGQQAPKKGRRNSAA